MLSTLMENSGWGSPLSILCNKDGNKRLCFTTIFFLMINLHFYIPHPIVKYKKRAKPRADI